MQSVTNTRIQIPGQATAGETHRIATVSGSEEGCNQVRNLIQTIINDQSSSNIMSGIPGQQHHQQQHFQQGGGYYGQQMQQQPNAGQQGYSTEWAAYYAAQQVAGQQQQQQRVDTQPALAATPAPEAAQTAADTYHEQFFRYAYYYGEDAARAYYGAWSPPVGTLNPYGVNPNGVQAAPSTTPQATPSAATVTVVAPAPKAAASVVVNSHDNLIVRDSGKRKVSNLPAWMTKS
jgi:far upstream element-binding protein